MKYIKTINELVKNPKLVSFYIKKIFLEFKKIGLDIKKLEIDKTHRVFYSYRLDDNQIEKLKNVEIIINKYKNIFLRIDYILSYRVHTFKKPIFDNKMSIIGASNENFFTLTLYIKNSKTMRVNTNRYVYHYSPSINRDSILKDGLVPQKFSESESWNNSLSLEYEDAIFAINGLDKKWPFAKNSDCWEIDTLNLKNKWWEDLNLGGCYIMTFESIPPKFIKLKNT